MTATSGVARLRYALTGTRTQLHEVRASPPMRVLTPKNHGIGAWAYLSSLGGGLLAGDVQSTDAQVESGACGFLGTQGPTRVFRSSSRLGTRSELRGRVADEGVLVVMPEPLVLFADARHSQRTCFELEGSGNLLWWEILGAGRVAREERWAFSSLDSLLELKWNGQIELRERWWLDKAHGAVARRMGRFDAWMTWVIAGPRLRPFIGPLQSAVAAQPVGPQSPAIFSLCRMKEDLAVLKGAAVTMEALLSRVMTWQPFVRELLQDDPFARRN